MKKLQVIEQVDTTDLRSGLNHSADKCWISHDQAWIYNDVTHEHPGEADHGEAGAEHEEHQEDGQHPGHDDVIQVIARVPDHDQAAQCGHHQGHSGAGRQVNRPPAKPEHVMTKVECPDVIILLEHEDSAGAGS